MVGRVILGSVPALKSVVSIPQPTMMGVETGAVYSSLLQVGWVVGKKKWKKQGKREKEEEKKENTLTLTSCRALGDL